MIIKEQINADLKTAMLAGKKDLATTIRGLKSAILYVEVAEGKREQGLSDAEITAVLQKEAKKRQESANLYVQGGNTERQQAELAEKAVIEKYLPARMHEEEIAEIVNSVIAETGASSMQDMGRVISVVKQKTGAAADGGTIARLVKEKLET
ncbi:GatB/YqeY domain-containing protein [soil metagenome]